MDGSKEHALFDTTSSQTFDFGHRHPSREPSRYRAVFGLGGELGFFLPFHSPLASPPTASFTYPIGTIVLNPRIWMLLS